jgi:hypothetical protein
VGIIAGSKEVPGRKRPVTRDDNTNTNNNNSSNNNNNNNNNNNFKAIYELAHILIFCFRSDSHNI